jgi:hypothetical protein
MGAGGKEQEKLASGKGEERFRFVCTRRDLRNGKEMCQETREMGEWLCVQNR